ncbi:MAG TPA: methylmalonyl-CoA mutase family protein, partial [Polyangia bacterium]
DAEQDQRARLAALRAHRDAARCSTALDALRTGARTSANLVPLILDAARADATLYEIRAAMEDVFGAYREPVFF